MRPFAELSARGRQRRIRALAGQALDRYDLDVVRLEMLRDTWNTMFRVTAADRQRYALRINRPGRRDLVAVRSELAWLAALVRDTDLLVPEPVPFRDGSLAMTLEAEGIPEPRHCVLFRWIEGRHDLRNPSTRTISLLGEAMARLHDHADRFQPPPDFTQQRLDTVWTFGHPDRIYSDEPDPLFSPERRRIYRQAADRVQAAIDGLYQDPLGIRFLHGDMHFGNIKLQQGRLAVLDFDDSMWCYPIQDIGISLYYLLLHPNAAALTAALRNGYTSVRPWPADDLTLFVQARALELVSLAPALSSPAVQAYLPRMLATADEMLSGNTLSSRLP